MLPKSSRGKLLDNLCDGDNENSNHNDVVDTTAGEGEELLYDARADNVRNSHQQPQPVPVLLGELQYWDAVENSAAGEGSSRIAGKAVERLATGRRRAKLAVRS